MLAAHLSLNYLGQLLGSATSRVLPIPKELGGVTPEGTCQGYVAALVLRKGSRGTLAPQILGGLWNPVLGTGKGIR